MSSPFLSSAAWAAIPAAAVGVGRTGRRSGGQAGRSSGSGTSSAASVEAAGADAAHDRGRHQAVDRAAARARRSRRSVEEMSRRGIATRSTRQPGPGGSECASPARSTTTTVARSRVSSSRRQVPMLATASAPSTRNSSRPGAASASSVSAVTDGAVALDLDRRGLDAVDARRPRARPARGGRPPTPRPCPASATDRPATTSSTRSRAELRRGPRPPPPRGPRAPGRTCPRTPRAAPCRRTAESTGARCLHSRRNIPRHLAPVRMRSSERRLRAGHARPRAGLAPRPSRRARARRVAHRCRRRRHRRHRRARAGRQRRRRRVRGRSCASAIALDLLVREIEEVDGASVEEVRIVDHFPDPRLDALESAQHAVRGGVVEALHRSPRRARPAREFLADWSALARRRRRCWRRPARSRHDASAARGAGRRHRRVADGRRRHHRSRRPRGGVVARRTTRRCSSGATDTPSAAGNALQLVALVGHRRPRPGPCSTELPGRVASGRCAAWRGRRLHPRPARHRPPCARAARSRGRASSCPLFVFDDAILAGAFNRAEPHRLPARVARRSRRALAVARWATSSCAAGDWVDEVAARRRTTSARPPSTSATTSARTRELGSHGSRPRPVPPASTSHRAPGMTVVAPGAVTPGDAGDHYKVFTPLLPALVRRAGGARVVAAPTAHRPARPTSTPGTLPVLTDLVDGRRARLTSMPGWRPGRATGSSTRGSSVGLRDLRRPPRRPPRRRDLAALAVPALRLRVTARGRARRRPAARAPTPFLRQLCWRDFYLQILAARPDAAWSDYRPAATAGTTIPTAFAPGRRAAPGTRSSTPRCASCDSEGLRCTTAPA